MQHHLPPLVPDLAHRRQLAMQGAFGDIGLVTGGHNRADRVRSEQPRGKAPPVIAPGHRARVDPGGGQSAAGGKGHPGLAATNCFNWFSSGCDRLRFIRPGFIGDTIWTIRENLSKVVHNATMGKLRVSYSVFKDGGEQVLYAEHLLTALYRHPADFAAEVAAKEAKRA